MMRVAARTVITLGAGMYAADLLRGEQPRLVACYSSEPGRCVGYFQALTLTQAALGLLIGVTVAFAMIPTASTFAIVVAHVRLKPPLPRR